MQNVMLKWSMDLIIERKIILDRNIRLHRGGEWDEYINNSQIKMAQKKAFTLLLRPQTMTFLALPNLSFTFIVPEYKEYFLDYYQDFYNYGSTIRN